MEIYAQRGLPSFGSNWLVALLIIAVLLIVGLTILAVFYVTKTEVASEWGTVAASHQPLRSQLTCAAVLCPPTLFF